MTASQLENTAKALASRQKIEDATIWWLQQNVLIIGMCVPQSFSQKLKMHSEIRGLITCHGMPAFWMTINPSDLRNPLVLKLADIDYPEESLATAIAAICHTTVISNPVVVAQFFNHICRAIFDSLIGSSTG